MSEEVLEARIEVLEEQIERLQEQLNEANRLIKMVSPIFSYGSDKIDNEFSDFYIYLKRWCVK